MVGVVRVPVVHAADGQFQFVSFLIEAPPGGVTGEESKWGIDHVPQPLRMLGEHRLTFEKGSIRAAGRRKAKLGEIILPAADGTDVVGAGALLEDQVSTTRTGKRRVHEGNVVPERRPRAWTGSHWPTSGHSSQRVGASGGRSSSSARATSYVQTLRK